LTRQSSENLSGPSSGRISRTRDNRLAHGHLIKGNVLEESSEAVGRRNDGGKG